MPKHTPSEKKKNKAISRKIGKLRGEGKPPQQAIAQAINTEAPERSRKRGKRRGERGPRGSTFT